MPSITDIRSQFPNLSNLTDYEVADIYAKGEGIDRNTALYELGIAAPSEAGFKSAFKNAIGSQVQGVGQIAHDMGWQDNPIERYGRSVQQANPMDIQSLGDIADRPWDAVKQGTGMALGYLAPGAVGRGLQIAGGATKAAGLTRAGNALNSMSAQTALAAVPSYGGIRDEQEAEGHNSAQDIGIAGLGALGVGAIETKLGAQRMLGIGKGANVGAVPSRAQFVQQLGSTPWRTVGKTAARTVGEEMGEELVQNPIEQLSAYQNPTTAANINETLTGSALAGLGTLGLGGVGGARMGMRHAAIKRDVATNLLDPTADFGKRNDAALWNQALLNRDGKDGDGWYNSFAEGAVQDANQFDTRSAIRNNDPAQLGQMYDMFSGDPRSASFAVPEQSDPTMDAYYRYGAPSAAQGELPLHDMFGDPILRQEEATPELDFQAGDQQTLDMFYPNGQPTYAADHGRGSAGTIAAFMPERRNTGAVDLRFTSRGRLTDTPTPPSQMQGNFNLGDWVPNQAQQPLALPQESTTPELDAYRKQKRVYDAQMRQFSLIKQKADSGAALSPYEAGVLRLGAPEAPVAPQFEGANVYAGDNPTAGGKLTITPQRDKNSTRQAIEDAARAWVVTRGRVGISGEDYFDLLGALDSGRSWTKVANDLREVLAANAALAEKKSFDVGNNTEAIEREAAAKLAAEITANHGVTPIQSKEAAAMGASKKDIALAESGTPGVETIAGVRTEEGAVGNKAKALTRKVRPKKELSVAQRKVELESDDNLMKMALDVYEGMTYEEVGEKYGVSAATVSNRLSALGLTNSRIAGIRRDEFAQEAGYEELFGGNESASAAGVTVSESPSDDHNVYTPEDAEDAKLAELWQKDPAKAEKEIKDRIEKAKKVINDLLQQGKDAKKKGKKVSDADRRTAEGLISLVRAMKESIAQHKAYAARAEEDKQKLGTMQASLDEADAKREVDKANRAKAEAEAQFDAIINDEKNIPAFGDFESLFDIKLESLPKNEQAHFIEAYNDALAKYETYDEVEQALLKEFTEYGREVTESNGSSRVQNTSRVEEVGRSAEVGRDGREGTRVEGEVRSSVRGEAGAQETALKDELTEKIEPIQGRRNFIKAFVGLAIGAVLPQSKAYAADFRSFLDKGDLAGALNSVATGSGNPAFRQLAKKLSGLIDKSISVRVVEPGKVYKEGIPTSLNSAYGVAKVNRESGKVTIFIRGDGSHVEETFLHEAIHAVLLSRYDMFNYYTANKSLRGRKADPVIDLYTKVWEEFRQFSMNHTGRNYDKAVYMELQKIDIGLAEAFHNIDEFITHSMTNPRVQDFMRQHRYRGQTLWGKFKEFVKGVLGFGGTEPTWLDAALRVGNEVLDAAAQDAPDYKVSKDILAKTGKSSGENYSLMTAENAERIGGATGRQLFTDTKTFMKHATNSLLFLNDLIDKAKAALPSATDWYNALQNAQSAKIKMERMAEDVAARADKLNAERYKQVCSFLADSTFKQKWGYQPTWRDPVTVDPEMRAQWNKLKPEEQKLVDEVFQHGADFTKRRDEIIKKLGIDDKLMPVSRLEGPYAPLKRFGKYVAVLKSAKLLEAEAAYAEQQSEKNAERVYGLKSNPEHFVSRQFDTMGAADKFVNEEGKKWAFSTAFEGMNRIDNNETLDYAVIQKILASIKADKLDKKMQDAMAEVVRGIYLSSVEEQSARTSGMRRKNRAGYDEDMIRSFLSAARANASFLANLEHGADMNDAFYRMQNEARGADGRRGAMDQFNTIAEHYKENLHYEDTPIQDRAVAFTSAMQLSTSLGYHVQNATQGLMVSVPWLAAQFNDYSGAWKHLMAGYGQLAKITKGALGFQGIDLSKVANPKLREALEHAYNLNLLDVGMQEDLSHMDRFRTGYKGADAASGVVANAVHRLRRVASMVETWNRVSSATAAYNMAIEKGKSHAQALAYVEGVLRKTQGDFSRADAPLLLKKLPKVTTQYRKFQFMMAAFYTGAFVKAFQGSTDVEKAIGRRMLGFKLFHTSMAAGALGLPLMNLAALAFSAIGGDEEPKDLEASLREVIGDETLANLLLHGPLAALGFDMSSRLGDDKIFSIAPYTEFDISSAKGLASTVVGIAGGPTLSQAGRMADGLGYMAKGDLYKGVERLLPKGFSSAMESFRLANEGYTLKNGDVLVSPEDISAFSLTLNAFGLPSTEIKTIQWMQRNQQKITQFYSDRSKEIEHDYARAVKEGDAEAMADLRESWVELQAGKDHMRQWFNDNPKELHRQPLSTLLKYPQSVAKRERQRQVAFGDTVQ